MRISVSAILPLVLLAVTALPALPTRGSAPGEAALRWWNPAESAVPVLEGQGWPREVNAPYDRLPARAEALVRKPVWALSRNATGLILRFKTTAPTITVEYAVKGKLSAPHFSATGMSGLDLYAVDRNGEWRWAPGKYNFGEKPGDTITYTYDLGRGNAGDTTGREYRLYLPIYNTVDWLKIGVPPGAVFEPLPVRAEKPIAIYGTSITQGACASRPGRAWPAIVGRRLETPVINLGFSGNGTLDKEMVALLAELEAKLFVLDCLGNMMDRKTYPRDEVKRRTIAAVTTLRARHPAVPIVLAEFGAFSKNRLDRSRGDAIAEQNLVLKDAFATLRKSGVKNIFLLTAEEMHMGIDDTTDYGHPNDLGLEHYADAFERVFRTALTDPAPKRSKIPE